MAQYLCKDRGLMPRLTAVRRIVRNGVFWFGTVEFDCLVWRFVWYEAVWFGTVEIDCRCWQLFRELCGMGLSDLEQSNSTASADNCLENCVVWGLHVISWPKLWLGKNIFSWNKSSFAHRKEIFANCLHINAKSNKFFHNLGQDIVIFKTWRENFKSNDYVTAYQSKSKQTITNIRESSYVTTIP